jgi:putative lipoprotein
MSSLKKNLVLVSLPPILFSVPPLFSQDPPSTPAKPAPAVKRAIEWKRFDYTCDAGAKIIVYLHNETVKVRFKDSTYLMKQVPSADGGRYSDGKVVWWSKGNGGFLQVDTPDGDGTMMVKDCKLDKPLNYESSANSVTGTVSYLQRIALPPTALIQVQLQDVSLADAPAKILAEEKITLGDRQVPVPFSLTVDPAKIDRSHLYSVSARILLDGQSRFISDKSYPVLTRGNPMLAEILVKQVSAAAPSKP